jgi:hypothetical protein
VWAGRCDRGGTPAHGDVRVGAEWGLLNHQL